MPSSPKTLPARGVSCDNYFSNNPVCTPARKSIFSGRYPHEHGSLTNRHGEMLSLPDTMIAYFKERAPEGIVYRPDDRHVDYWLNHSLPIVVVLVDVASEAVWWQSVSQDIVERTGKGWKMVVPETQKVDG